MRRKWIGGAAVALAASLAGAGQAQADVDVFVVDTTSDNALAACTGGAGDCSLRGAFTNADDGDSASDTDLLLFDQTIFDGVETVPGDATVVMPGSGVTSDENLNLQTTCSTTSPCVGIDGPPADIAIRVQDGRFQMNGIALYGTGLTGLQHSNTGDGLTLFNNWFGLTLAGTPSGNQTGLFIAGPAADVGTVGSTGNVFAANEVGIQMFGNAAQDIDVLNNRFGVKADGTVAANTFADIDIAGNVANQAPSNVAIGPSSGNDTPTCDEGCNVIAAAGGASGPRGVNLSAGRNPGDTSTASNVTIQNNHIGVNAAGTGATGTGVLVAAGAADDVTVRRNRMAGGAFAVDAGSGAEDLMVQSNSIGTNADGTAVLDGTSDSSIAVNSNGAAAATIQGNLIAADSPINAITVGGGGATIAANQIGLSGVASSGGGTGLRVEGSSHLIQGNSIGNVTADAINLAHTTGSAIAGNLIGVLGPVADSGVTITGVGGASVGNAIGSNDPGLSNEFGDVGEDAIRIVGDGQDQNQILANVGGPAGGLFVDLEGTDGPGNGTDGPNAGILAPKVKQLTAKAISGTGVPGATVWVYRSGSPKGDFPQELRKLIGTKTVKDDGTWKLKPGGNGVRKSWVVTANQNDTTGSGSEFAKGKQRRLRS